MADKYARAAGGNWSANATWALTDGGVEATTPPSASENAFFSNQSGNVVVDAAATCLDLDCTKGTGYAGTLSGSATLAVSGNFKLNAAMTRTYTGAITFNATATGKTITSAGKTLASNLTFNGAGGGWTLQDALTNPTGFIDHVAGTLNTNGQTVSIFYFTATGSGTRVLTLGASALTISAAASQAPSFAPWMLNGTNLTLNANTSTITFTGNNTNFVGGGKTYNNVVFAVSVPNAGAMVIQNADTYANLTLIGTAAKGDTLRITANIVVTGTFTVTGNSVINRVKVETGTTPGVQRTITAAAVALTNVDFQDIAGAGAAAPFTGTSLGDCLGNSGITFDASVAQTHTASAGGNWSDVTKWTSRVPLPQDDVTVDANTTGTLTADMPRLGRSINFTGFAGTWTPNVAMTAFGSIALASGMTLTGANQLTLSARSAATITSAGKQWGRSISIAAPSGTYTLADALDVGTFAATAFTLAAGTFNDGGFNVTTLSALFTAGATLIKSGTWTLTGTGFVWNMVTGLTFTDSGGTIKITDVSGASKTFSGGAKTYNNLWFSGLSIGHYVINNNNVFNDLKVDPGNVLLNTAGNSATVASLTASGTAPGVGDVKVGRMFGLAGSYFSTPDSVANSITGDIDFRVKVAMTDWTPGATNALVVKSTDAGSQKSYQFRVGGTGALNIVWYTDGVITGGNNSSTAVVPAADGAALWVRVTVDVNNGAGGNDIKFYTSSDYDPVTFSGTWTQLGTTITTAGVTSIFDSTAVLELGSRNIGVNDLATASIYRAQIFNGIDGTLAVDFNPESYVSGTTWPSATGETWTINGSAMVKGTNQTGIGSTTAANHAIAKSGGGYSHNNYLSVNRSTVSPENTFYVANSINGVPSTTGWVFGGFIRVGLRGAKVLWSDERLVRRALSGVVNTRLVFETKKLIFEVIQRLSDAEKAAFEGFYDSYRAQTWDFTLRGVTYTVIFGNQRGIQWELEDGWWSGSIPLLEV